MPLSPIRYEHRRVPIDKIKLPGDFQRFLDDPKLENRTASIRRIGLLHDPVVRAETRELLSGRHRIAALMKAGEDMVDVKLAYCTDAEAAMITLAENCIRKHDPAEQAKETERYLRLVDEYPPAEPNPMGGRGRGRPPTARGLAMKALAEERGVTVEAIRRAMARQAERDRKDVEGEPREKKPVGPAGEVIPLGIDSLGTEMSKTFQRDVGQIETVCLDFIDAVKRGRNKFNGLSLRPVREDRWNLIKEKAAELMVLLEDMIPRSVCPSCRNDDKKVEHCAGCVGTGYVTKSELLGVPRELLKRDEVDPFSGLEG